MTSISVEAVQWQERKLVLLDQRLLPGKEEYLTYDSPQGVAESIRLMVVRGAPAIGISAAYGVVLAALKAAGDEIKLQNAIDLLAESRPTAVNLFWALQRMQKVVASAEPNLLIAKLEEEAIAIHREDIEANHRMGGFGAEVIANELRGGDAINIITHCNTGTLATGGYGTALGVIRSGYEKGIINEVFADETRPWLQGARLTAWELSRDNIPVRLIADSAAAHVMQSQDIKWIIVGADRITANGDVANKIGTYSLAVLARHHGAKFMVAAPISTVDTALQNGSQIPIEQRASDEIKQILGAEIAPDNVEAYNPVFDVTPAELVDFIVTEKGVVERPTEEKIRALFEAH